MILVMMLMIFFNFCERTKITNCTTQQLPSDWSKALTWKLVEGKFSVHLQLPACIVYYFNNRFDDENGRFHDQSRLRLDGRPAQLTGKHKYYNYLLGWVRSPTELLQPQFLGVFSDPELGNFPSGEFDQYCLGLPHAHSPPKIKRWNVHVH